jgi:23S rRNA A1618 N6-methylase RlmF
VACNPPFRAKRAKYRKTQKAKERGIVHFRNGHLGELAILEIAS